MSPDPFSARKLARQSRARETIDAILGAAGRMVDREGVAGLTTNRIAELAGVSIGSLYQYFPGKDAVLHALVEREFNRVVDATVAHIEALDTSRLSLEEGVASIVDQIFAGFGARRPLYAALLQSVLSIRHLRFTLENDARILEVVRRKIGCYCGEASALEAATFVALYAMKGVQIGMAFANRPTDDAAMRAAIVRAIVASVSVPKP